MSKIKVPGGAFYAGEGLNVDPVSRTVSANGGGNVQPDWNQNDVTAEDYIKNRPFYVVSSNKNVLLDNETINFEGKISTIPNVNFSFENGATYSVSWDGVVYNCIAYNFSGTILIGNKKLFTSDDDDDTGEPFCIGVEGTNLVIAAEKYPSTYTVEISQIDENIIKIDEKYLPISTGNNYGLVKYSDVFKHYDFPGPRAPRDAFIKAVREVEDHAAFITWNGSLIIDARLENDIDNVVDVIFYNDPFVIYAYDVEKGQYYDENARRRAGVNVATVSTIYFANLDSESKYDSFLKVDDSGTLSINGNHLATENKAIGMDITGASVGQTIKIKSVDENGTPTAWEVEGIPTSITLQSSTPGSTKRFKITVDDSGTLTATETTV